MLNPQLKVRGISFETNSWLYGYLVEVKYNNFFIFDSPELSQVNGRCVHQIPSSSRQVYKETISRNIGLADKDYKEIYEGDIVEYTDSKDNKTKLGIIEYLQEELGFVVSTEESYFRLGFASTSQFANYDPNLKVIGNIYQNKELITWIKKKEF